ncbi:MAG: hypothetical protein NVSMB19_09420 [Vulcanimicrobiaceae bacterium]
MRIGFGARTIDVNEYKTHYPSNKIPYHREMSAALGDRRLPPHGSEMAAKRKIAPPKPRLDLPWSELKRAQQNQLYTKALHAYTIGQGENPGSTGDFHRKRVAAEAKG